MHNSILIVLDKARNRNILFLFLAFFVFIFSKDFGFYHDDITFGSRVGNHLYNTSLFNWLIPEKFDSGHPPFFGFILAIFWKIFGRNLWVSHLLMVPFVFGFLVQINKFVEHYVENKTYQILAFLLIIADPTVFTSFVLVNMEIISLFLFFLTVNSIKNNTDLYKYIGLSFLSILSIRYMMLFAGICVFEILQKIFIDKKSIKQVLNRKFVISYFCCALPGIIFMIWRYSKLGYITNPNSPWASYGHLVDFKYFIRNCIVFIWRFVDFGRGFIMLFLAFNFLKYYKKIMDSKKNQEILLLSVTAIFFITITIMATTNTMALRYFIVSYVCLNLLSFRCITLLYSKKIKIIYSLLIIGLFTGNLWVYPKTLSQAWHNTLGHVPYHSLRIDAINYLKEENIDIEEVGSFFPNYTQIDLIDLGGNLDSFAKFTGENKYVFCANIYNLSDQELKKLDKNYAILKEFNKLNISIKIYTLKE